jgi:hypothetical protein
MKFHCITYSTSSTSNLYSSSDRKAPPLGEKRAGSSALTSSCGPRCGEGWSACQRRVYKADVWNPVNALSGTTFQHVCSLSALLPAAEFSFLTADPIRWLGIRSLGRIVQCTDERPSERFVEVNAFACVPASSVLTVVKRRPYGGMHRRSLCANDALRCTAQKNEKTSLILDLRGKMNILTLFLHTTKNGHSAN